MAYLFRRYLTLLLLLPVNMLAQQTPTPSFTLSLGRKSISVASPTQTDLDVTTSITVVALGGFSESVTVTATGGTPGISLKFAGNSNQATFDHGSGTAPLTITVGTTVLPGEYSIQIDALGGSAHQKDEISVAVGVGGEFDLMLGVGSLIVNSNVTDYKINNQNSLLQTTNLGRATPQLLVGGAFRLPFGNFTKGAANRFGPRPWYAFLSLKFSPQSSQTFSGYVIGGSYKLTKVFAFLAGYALTPVQEPSPGFRAAAVQIVVQNPTVPIYQRFDANALQRNSLNAYDGFPLFVQSLTGPTATRVFDGDPTVVHYHGGFIIGVAIPISLGSKLGVGGGK